MKGPLLTLVLVVVACSGSNNGSGEACAPAGTYTASFSRAAEPGDCPVDLPQPASQDIALREGEACGSYVATVSGQTLEGCAAAVTVSAVGGRDGLSSGEATIAVDCAAVGGGACTARYVVYFERRE